MKKKDEKYECGECGLVVVVDNPCGSSPCDLICCNVPMKEVRRKPKDKDPCEYSTNIQNVFEEVNE